MIFNSIIGTDNDDQLKGGIGNDKILGKGGDDKIIGDIGDDNISGGKGNDTIYGNTGDDKISGDDGDDRIFGDIGNDKILGGPGNDKIIGGIGADIIYGGKGKDIFYYDSIHDSHISLPDKIMDFESGIDKIDISLLREIDNNNINIKHVNNFSGKKNEMIVDYDKEENLSALLLDHNGDGQPEFEIKIVGIVNPAEDIITFSF